MGHSSLNEANKAAKELFDGYDKNGKETSESESNGKFHGELIVYNGYNPSIIKISVDELTLDKLTAFELKQLRIQYDIKNNTEKLEFELTKNDLINMIYPTIQHKKHQN